MTKVLVVDDQPTNRFLLTSILEPNGYAIVESSDGAEALVAAEETRPDLIITDVLMPTMDGFEFMRHLRAKPAFASTPVIFCTAHYLERDARTLAAECGVLEILCKPIKPLNVLEMVNRVLGGGKAVERPIPDVEAFGREHLSLLTNKVARQTEDLRNANLRLKALTELGLQLNLNWDRKQLGEAFCRAARQIVGASSAAVIYVSEKDRSVDTVHCSGIDSASASALEGMAALEGILQEVYEGANRRHAAWSSGSLDLGLPRMHHPIHSFLGVRAASPARVYAVLALCNRIGKEQFDEADEELATTLAAQLAVACDNWQLLEEAKARSAALQRQLEKEKAMEESLRRSEQRLQAILDNTNAVIYLASPEGRVLLALPNGSSVRSSTGS
jgi:CheY-like chemotaxis protein